MIDIHKDVVELKFHYKYIKYWIGRFFFRISKTDRYTIIKKKN